MLIHYFFSIVNVGLSTVFYLQVKSEAHAWFWLFMAVFFIFTMASYVLECSFKKAYLIIFCFKLSVLSTAFISDVCYFVKYPDAGMICLSIAAQILLQATIELGFCTAPESNETTKTKPLTSILFWR